MLKPNDTLIEVEDENLINTAFAALDDPDHDVVLRLGHLDVIITGLAEYGALQGYVVEA